MTKFLATNLFASSVYFSDALKLSSGVNDLHHKSGAGEFGVSREEFTEIARQIAYHDHLNELILARACASGNEAAWNRFVALYREKLNAFALSITRDPVTARELADSLYADLYGTRLGPDGRRASRLNSYKGHGSLEGWLHAVIAQEYVNRYRAGRALVSYDAEVESGAQFAEPVSFESTDEQDSRVAHAFDAAIGELDPEDRFLLASYFLDGRTLAAVAELLGVHESTVSRRLARITRTLRRSIIRKLGELGIGRNQAVDLFSTAIGDFGLDLRRLLRAPSGARKP
jgi:RNA polymerase sigma-70 factor (ECF subfamily)